MNVWENKFLEIAEFTFYIIYISCLILVTSAPIITIGASITSGYSAFILLEENDRSISVLKLTLCYFKTMWKKCIKTTGVTLWFIITIYCGVVLYGKFNENIVILSMVIFAAIEMVLLQTIFMIYAKYDKISYIDALLKSLYFNHRYLNKALPMVFIQLILIFLVFVSHWTIIVCIGLWIYINFRIGFAKISK
jgi:hypothetical protein